MKKTLVTISLTLLISTSWAFIPNPYKPKAAANCKLHALYCKIIELQPNADPMWAMKLSNSLIRHAKKHEMDPWLSLAIAMQESGLRNKHRKTKSIIFKEKCNQAGKCKKTHEIVHGNSDIGVFQFHVNTIINKDIDPVLLTEDMDYMVDWHFRFLKEKKNMCQHLGVEWWGCYHSRTPELHSRYIRKVSRYYHGSEIISKKQKLALKENVESIKQPQEKKTSLSRLKTKIAGWFSKNKQKETAEKASP